ncbi:hypothetical protein SPRG_14042 [Saprolegnia parasitica CBS 223.65]|uniref:WRKY19-like zinc finger domain-containing protein n=1 Tax=Saprolegnia parasitica (strain CBS 223.65) TaxID=695850 RepID=A0A067C314_SAPPC|nr:hypothetical protein SPRG_14042 [Saprolegnia parasitica CBS 223.65]KDO20951.1 hypothetical protein SPRG_14042 [Saprolegnia parasitica CBS 223.65]|eukprot:XP_012208342.1 hypothetical protein SPRG_14042 [Saprolegnia parasitica CBS 223.65]
MASSSVRMNSFPGYRFPNKPIDAQTRYDHESAMMKYELLHGGRYDPNAYDYSNPQQAPTPTQTHHAPGPYSEYNPPTTTTDPRLFYNEYPQSYAANPTGNYSYGHDNLAPMPLPSYEGQRYKHLDADFLDEAIQCIPQLDALEGMHHPYGRPTTTLNTNANAGMYSSRHGSASYSPSSNAPSSTGSTHDIGGYRPARKPTSASEKANPRLCRVPGCNKGIRSRGLCKGHDSDQGGGHCIAHGGGRRCSEPGCTRSAQARGRCKCHGGGRPCKYEGCGKNSQRSGYCMTHAKLVEQSMRANDDATSMSL